MAQSTDENALGCLFFIGLMLIGACVKSCDKAQNRKIKEDYSSPPSEMGHFKSSYDGGVHARDFTVRNGVGYLTLDDGDVIKLKRIGEGRYSGLNYEAVQTAGGYNIIRHGRQ